MDPLFKMVASATLSLTYNASGPLNLSESDL